MTYNVSSGTLSLYTTTEKTWTKSKFIACGYDGTGRRSIYPIVKFFIRINADILNVDMFKY